MSYESYVLSNPDLLAHYNAQIKGKTNKSMEKWGQEHWGAHGQKEKRRNTPTSTKTTQEDVAKTQTGYVDQSPDLAAAYARIQSDPTDWRSKYWLDRMGGQTSKEAFGQAHAAEDMALKQGTYQGGTKYTKGSDAWKGLFTSTPGQFDFAGETMFGTTGAGSDAPKTRWELFSPYQKGFEVTTPSGEGGGGGGGGGGDGGDGGSSINDNIQTMDLATLTDEMDLSNKLTEIINMNSPMFKAAQTKALQAMQARGIMNSSLATEAVMDSILKVALPVAQAEVQSLQNNLYYNTDWTNQQKTAANKYFHDRMLTQLKGQIDMQLNKMIQSFGAWGKYGDWLTTIATTGGADQAAWKRMLDLLQGSGGWPNYPGT